MIKKSIVFLSILIAPFIVFAYPKGDVDGDGKAGSSDYILVRKHILKQTTLTGDKLTRADVNGDNKITSLDFVAIRKLIISGGNVVTSTPQPTTADGICESVKNNASIDYKSFASLKKDNDDYYVIKAAHDCANKYNKPVIATKADYHIYKKNTDIISVKTNTNLNNSTIYIHDEFDNIYEYEKVHIYNIEPNTQDVCTTTTTDFNNAFTSTVPSSGKYFMFITEQDGKKVYHRNKGNGYTEQEKSKRDAYRVYEGVLQDPIFWDYNNTKVKYKKCVIPNNQLVFENATIKNVTRNKCEKCSGYMKRGLSITRNNTKISNIKHYYVDKNNQNTYEIQHAYNGFFAIDEVADILVENSTVYALFYNMGKGDNGSTYDMTIARSANVKLDNVKMFEDSKNQMKDENYWSVMTTYECKNLTVENSKLNTVSAHTNVYNLTVKNSTIGSRGIIVAGTGDRNDNKIELENVTWKYTDYLVKIRGDYGTTWNGTIKIKNGIVKSALVSTIEILRTKDLKNNSNPKLVWGQPIYNPTKVTIDGLNINSSNVKRINIYSESKSDIDKYYLTTFQRKTNKNEETKISKKNITGNGSNSVYTYWS